jgi:hypothetical protein
VLVDPFVLFSCGLLLTGGCRVSELSVGSNTEGIEVRSVGNSAALQETALIEAFNLKAAIEYQVPNRTHSLCAVPCASM